MLIIVVIVIVIIIIIISFIIMSIYIIIIIISSSSSIMVIIIIIDRHSTAYPTWIQGSATWSFKRSKINAQLLMYTNYEYGRSARSPMKGGA